MKSDLKIIFTGSPKTQVQAMTKLLSSGKEQVRLVKELGGNARLLYDAKFEYLDIHNPQITPLMESALVIFLIKDRESINALERLVRSKAVESAIDYIVISTIDIGLRIKSGMRDTPVMDKLITYTDPISSQIAFSVVKLIEANSESIPFINIGGATSIESAKSEKRSTEAEIKIVTVQSTPMEAPIGNITDSLQVLISMDGALGACVVDSTSGMILGKSSVSDSNINLEIEAAGNTEVLRAKLKTMQARGAVDQIEDMLITLGNEIHILRPMKSRSVVFLCVVLDKSLSNLALARMKTADIEASLVL
jgi:hypothetical protein